MVELTWLSVGAAAVAALFAYVLWAQSYWRRRGVVQTKTRFVLGDLWAVMMRKETLGANLIKLYRKYEKEPFLGVYKQLSPLLIVKDPELINEVLVKNFGSFANNEIIFPEGKDNVLGDNPFVATFDRWKELRSRLSGLFSPSRVKTAFADLAESSRCLADFIAAAGEGSQDTLLLCKRFTAHASARVLFGIESHSLEVGSGPGVFYDMGHDVFNGGFIQRMRFGAFFLCPSLLHIIGYELVETHIINFFKKLIRDSVEYRLKEGVTRDDFVQYAAKTLVVDGKVDEKLLQKMTGQAINSFIETFETSGLTLALNLLMLATNPKEQERLRAELREHPKLDYETVTTLPFLDQVFKESMRHYPAADTVRRSCTKATTLRAANGRSVDVEVGTTVYVPVDAVHHDPAHYSHPDDFWPDHFSPEEMEGRARGTYLAWGDGPRQCPGSKYASLKVKTALATIIQRFEVSVGEQQVLPVQRDPNAQFLGFIGGVWLKFRAVP